MKPTVGRIVYFTPRADQPHYESAPLAAIVTAVLSDNCVSLAVFGPTGRPYSEDTCNVTLVQPDNDKPSEGGFCEWPTKVEEESESAEKPSRSRKH